MKYSEKREAKHLIACKIYMLLFWKLSIICLIFACLQFMCIRGYDFCFTLNGTMSLLLQEIQDTCFFDDNF